MCRESSKKNEILECSGGSKPGMQAPDPVHKGKGRRQEGMDELEFKLVTAWIPVSELRMSIFLNPGLNKASVV